MEGRGELKKKKLAFQKTVLQLGLRLGLNFEVKGYRRVIYSEHLVSGWASWIASCIFNTYNSPSLPRVISILILS